LTLNAAAKMMRAARQNPQQAPAQAAPAQPAAPEPAPRASVLEPDPAAVEALQAEAQAEPAPADQSPRYKVKIDGQEVEVSLEEALAGYSREQDYRKKTMRHAEAERALEVEQAATRAERQRAAQELDRALNEIASLVLPEADLDRLLETNPDAYHRERRRREKVQVAISERLRLAEQEKAAWYADLARLTNAEQQKLLEARPEWRNPDTYRQVQTDMRDYAVSVGFNHQDVNNVRDHRIMLVLEKAMKYDKLLSQRPKAQAPPAAAQAPAPLRPGTASPNARHVATAVVRQAEATFGEAPSMKNALRMLAAKRGTPNGAAR
jgi:hypothetical protein